MAVRFIDYSEGGKNAIVPGKGWRTRAIVKAHDDSPDWVTGVDDKEDTWSLRLDPRRAGKTPTIDLAASAASISGDGRTITVDFAATAAQTGEVVVTQAEGSIVLLVDLFHEDGGLVVPYVPMFGTCLAIAGAGSL